MKKHETQIVRGIRQALPLLLGVVPFGLVTGAMTMKVAAGYLEAQGMSLSIYAGASQLAVLQLVMQSAAFPVLLFTGVVINLRMLMYSAYVAPHFGHEKWHWKAVIAYVLTDQAFALSVPVIEDGLRGRSLREFYLGAAVTVWLCWQLTFAIGAQVGASIPASWGMEFIIPVMFLAMVVPVLVDRPSLCAALSAAITAVAFRNVPLNLGLLAASMVGVCTGVALEIRRER